MKNYSEEFLNHKILRPKLITMSLFIAVYENFKMTIVDNVKFFYCTGFENNEYTFQGYEEKVLSKVKKGVKQRQIKATLIWLKQNGAIDDKDIETCEKISALRNRLVHDMTKYIYEDLPDNLSNLYISMIELFKKIMRWWINEIEIPISGEYTPGEYNPEEVRALNIDFLQIITDIAINENDEYLKMYKEVEKNRQKNERT